MEYLTRVKEYDWVYLVVSPQNPHKGAEKLLTAKERYDAAVAAVRRHPELHVWVDDIEMLMDPPYYTIRTLDALKRREPDNDFTLVIGADNLEGIHRWRDFPRILSEYGVAVYPRRGFDIRSIREKLYEECLQLPQANYVLDASQQHTMDGTMSLEDDWMNLYNIQIIDAPLSDISSTEIREAQARGEDMSAWLM